MKEKAGVEESLALFSDVTAKWFTDTLGEPTAVQKQAWPAIAGGGPVLISAPTGTGKTLSAFLVFLDRLQQMADQGELKQELNLIYISPLKSLASDIRENLQRPLLGIAGKQSKIEAAIRTGDTSQAERRQMIKHPPHILITTPESLYLLLTSKTGRSFLRTAKTLIIDEMHALIDTKRGAHLLFSIARLEKLCGGSLQRIGLSATIEPLTLAARWLSPEPARIVAPRMEKMVEISVAGTVPAQGRRKDPVWEELARKVYDRCMDCRSVIAFSEGRRYAEKLAYYVNELGGPGFAGVHHGSLSKEQRQEMEEALRSGRLRLLCATSSMELGIDVGEIDEVLQVGCPQSIASAMQRLGRAGHNPGRVSIMRLYPRTAQEGLLCGMTAQLAKIGGIEEAAPPRLCLDVLAQHLVSMACAEVYTVDDVLALTARAWPFYGVTRQMIKDILAMEAGDYEHRREIPVRPRLLYDRIHETVLGDGYSRLLAVSAGGTIPDKGMYAARTLEGVKVGELDEEFVYESRIGEKFLLGAFGWKIVGMDKDTVLVEQAQTVGAKLPFWKGTARGRSLKTSLAFGKIMGGLFDAQEKGRLREALEELGLDRTANDNAAAFLQRQIKATGALPDDRTIIAEHFRDANGCHQVMYHAILGRRVNAPLALLLQHTVQERMQLNVGCVEEEDGILLYPYGEARLPEHLLQQLDPDTARPVLEALLLTAPLFGMTFRYNAARALLMGMRGRGRQPLWLQRIKSADMLDGILQEKDHPLLLETRRECLEDLWDLDGLEQILRDIRVGKMKIVEIWTESPSPMCLPLQWQVEAAEMYEYAPTTPKIGREAAKQIAELSGQEATKEALDLQQHISRLPEDSQQLHALLMREGDLLAGELAVPWEWLEELAREDRAAYIEPGLWIAAEQRESYEKMLDITKPGQEDIEETVVILRRMLFYRGAKSAEQIKERYCLLDSRLEQALELLCRRQEIIAQNGVYYHKKHYARAQLETLRQQRARVQTQPPRRYAALMAGRVQSSASGQERVKEVLEEYCSRPLPAAFWEEVLLPARVRSYRSSFLDQVLAEGAFTWQLTADGEISFFRTEDADWDWEAPAADALGLKENEALLYEALCRRGASFLRPLSHCLENGDAQEVLLSLAQKGLVCADSFLPVRQWLNREKIAKKTLRQQINARVQAQSAGRWDLVRPVRQKKLEDWLEELLTQQLILCRETYRKQPGAQAGWAEALEVLRIWEYVGKVRRGYFVSGMSGAQFIRREDYSAVVQALAEHTQSGRRIIWLHAADPAQIWGKQIAHQEGRAFLNVQGTAAALAAGSVVAVFEKNAKILRLFDTDCAGEALLQFAEDFAAGRIYGSKKRLVVKEYPPEAAGGLLAAGFIREMQDYVLYR